MKTTEAIEMEQAYGIPLGPFHRQWLMLRAPERARRWLEKERRRQESGWPPIMGMPRQGLGALDINDPNTADFTARNTFTTEVSLLGGDANGAPTQGMVNQYCAIAPNDARAGKLYRMVGSGTYGTTGTPTLIWTPRWGSSTTIGTNVTLGASQTITGGSTVSNQPWFFMFEFVVRTAPPGVTLGTGKGGGIGAMGTSTTVALPWTWGHTAATIDTTGQGTAACGLQCGVTWSASSASNTILPEIFYVKSEN